MSGPTPEREQILQEITITKLLKDDGFVFRCKFKDYVTDDLIPFLDGLGLLEAAKVDFLDQNFEVGPYAKDPK